MLPASKKLDANSDALTITTKKRVRILVSSIQKRTPTFIIVGMNLIKHADYT